MKNHSRVIRLITAGSVDDGKSTLIGRLLYDSKVVLIDQLESVKNSRHNRVKPTSPGSSDAVTDASIDFSLFTDGLEAEREQGITIDIAYRYFSTARRKFILADCPGHEQYTRNMVTGASNADCALVLIDASRLPLQAGKVHLLPQTKRHSSILKMLDIEHVLVVVNKMDLIGYDQAHFQAIMQAYRELAMKLGWGHDETINDHIHGIPVSALRGENIVNASTEMPWYQGVALLAWLENLESKPVETCALRLPVQSVQRLDADAADDFRGYQGCIESGALAVGDTVCILPSRHMSTIAAIYHLGTRVEQVEAGDMVTITLNDDIDISRGDMIVHASQEPACVRTIQADVCWLDPTPSHATRKYWLRHNTAMIYARIESIDYVRDMTNTETLLEPIAQQHFAMNDLGRATLKLQKPLPIDPHSSNPNTGTFVLIDIANHQTVAAGIVIAGA